MVNKRILFSIVVPIYNVEKYLDKCIKSILGQTYDKFELILVDDGSTDNSAVLCDLYKEKDKRIQVIHKKNGGLVSARKVGISIARGDYAVCVDSDDWIDKEHLMELNMIIEAHSPDIICFNHFEVNEGAKSLRDIQFRKGLYTKDDIEKEIYPQIIRSVKGKAFPPTIWAKVYRMDLYKSEQIRIDDRIKIGEDVACTIPCMIRAESIYILDKALYYYRRNNISMTKIKKPISWDGPELIELHLRKRIKSKNCDFQNQISRRTVQSLINVVKTQFYSQDKYIKIARNIKTQLNRTIYANAIEESHFEGMSATGVFHLFLKHSIFFPFYLLSKIR
ncbi:MAG: glycosyltransferase family 2 protein [Lachnospiraceae bacterium]|nr:glycosyltransferase family 2 protein [Lachnospiraceae bacterium]